MSNALHPCQRVKKPLIWGKRSRARTSKSSKSTIQDSFLKRSLNSKSLKDKVL